MSRYDILTKHLNTLNPPYGKWDTSSAIPSINYTNEVVAFIRDVYLFTEETDSYQYAETLSRYGIAMNVNAAVSLDLSLLPGEAVFALLLFVIRGERFMEGIIETHLENGFFLRLLKRLEEIDNAE